MVRCVLAGVLFAVTACYQPDVASCTYTCAAGATPCPDGMSCVADRCVHEGDTCDDGTPNFFELQWDAPAPIPGLVDVDRCERRPVLDPSGTRLILARPTAPVVVGNDCLATAHLELYEWRDGSPSQIGTPADVAPTSPVVVGTFLGEGAAAGLSAGNRVFLYRADTGGGAVLLHRAELTNDLKTVVAAGAPLPGFPANTEATFDANLRHIIYAANNDLFEGTGSPSTGYPGAMPIAELNTTADLEVTPTMSPDGRVIVFVRTTGGSGGQTDLFVSRRMSISDAWGAPERLPVGQFQINSADRFEYDPYIARNGDLLFTSTRAGDGSRRRVFLARHR